MTFILILMEWKTSIQPASFPSVLSVSLYPWSVHYVIIFPYLVSFIVTVCIWCRTPKYKNKYNSQYETFIVSQSGAFDCLNGCLNCQSSDWGLMLYSMKMCGLWCYCLVLVNLLFVVPGCPMGHLRPCGSPAGNTSLWWPEHFGQHRNFRKRPIYIQWCHWICPDGTSQCTVVYGGWMANNVILRKRPLMAIRPSP